MCTCVFVCVCSCFDIPYKYFHKMIVVKFVHLLFIWWFDLFLSLLLLLFLLLVLQGFIADGFRFGTFVTEFLLIVVQMILSFISEPKSPYSDYSHLTEEEVCLSVCLIRGALHHVGCHSAKCVYNVSAYGLLHIDHMPKRCIHILLIKDRYYSGIQHDATHPV